jgi:hypothetical protein
MLYKSELTGNFPNFIGDSPEKVAFVATEILFANDLSNSAL